MQILQSDNIFSTSTKLVKITGRRKANTYFLNATSFTKSFPPLMLSARNTFPVVAIATI